MSRALPLVAALALSSFVASTVKAQERGWVTAVPPVPALPEPEPEPLPVDDIVPIDMAGASPIAEGLAAEFGQGVTIASEDGAFSLTLRGRLQARVVFGGEPDREDDEEPYPIGFFIRRARLVFLGHLFTRAIQFYIQFGFSPLDMEPDLLIPLRDAVITWMPHRDFMLRVGQMKVPFNRERVISSSALQMVDRSAVNAEMNLDRDIGVQIFSNDLFGFGGVLGYQLGVFNGEGRNRFSDDLGLLYVARLQVQPFGRFDDAFSEADLTREDRPRLSFGGGFGYNDGSQRRRSTHGNFYEHATFDTFHAEGDLIFKMSGFSLQLEVLWRGTSEPLQEGVFEGMPWLERARTGLGYMAQLGYYFAEGVEVAARFAELRPLEEESGLGVRRDAHLSFGWYILEHNLKLQADYGLLFSETIDAAVHQVRAQLQVFY